MRKSRGKKAMRCHSEQRRCPRRKNPLVVKAGLGCRQPKRSSKSCRDPEELDRDLTSGWRTRIASQPLLPRETRVRPLRAGQDHIRGGWRSGSGRRQAHLDTLVSHELHAGMPMFFPAPISPEERGRTNLERMQQHAHLTRLCRRSAIPLTLLPQRAGTTTANAGTIHHAQTAIGFSAVFMRKQFLVSGNLDRADGILTTSTTYPFEPLFCVVESQKRICSTM
jgi:hypothetical protein